MNKLLNYIRRLLKVHSPSKKSYGIEKRQKIEENDMAVIVKGMTMPESCEKCRFLFSFGPCYKICSAVDRELIVTDLFKVRHDECPLCEAVLGLDIANGEDFTGGV